MRPSRLAAALAIAFLALVATHAAAVLTTPTFSSPKRIGGDFLTEPSLLIAPDNRVYVAAPSGIFVDTPFLPAGTFVWRSNGAGNFDDITPPPFAVGGGDSDIVRGPDGWIYATDLWLGAITVWSSANGGTTWSQGNPIASGTLGNDRMWLTVGPDGAVYLLYNQLESGYWVAKSTNHGATFVPIPAAPAGQYPPGAFVARSDGLLAFAHSNDIPSSLAGAFGLGVNAAGDRIGYGVFVTTSTNGGMSWTTKLVAPEWGQNLFPALALDSAGTLYAVWAAGIAEENTPLHYAFSTNGGATWSAVRTIPTGTGANYIPWAIAKGAGHLGVAYIHTNTGASSSSAAWHVKYTMTLDATAAAPSWTTGQASTSPAIEGAVSGRPVIGDFLTVKTFSDGRSAVVWSQDSANGPFINYVAQTAGSLL